MSCMLCGVLVGLSLRAPSLARLSAISFLIMPECARTLCMWIVCGVQQICCTMAAMSNLSG